MNKTTTCFWTSDSPVVFYNQFLEPLCKNTSNIGFVTKGLQIFYPISPKCCLVFFDENVYGIGGKTENVIEVTNISDIEQINLIQYIEANKVLFFNEEFNEDYLVNFSKRFMRLRREEKFITQEFQDPKNPLGSIIVQQGVDIKCNLNLSFIRLLRKAQKQSFKLKNMRNVLIPRSEETLRLAEYLENNLRKVKRKAI